MATSALPVTCLRLSVFNSADIVLREIFVQKSDD